MGLGDLLQDEAEKRGSWDKTNVRMWGKRGYDEDDGDYVVSYYWPARADVDGVKLVKRQSRGPSSVNELVVPGWAKNAWERNNMRIWG